MKKLITVLMLLFIPGFIFGFGIKLNDNKSEDGYVYSLTDEEIVSGNSSTKGMVKRNSYNNKTTISISRFSGIDSVVSFSPKNQSVELTLSSKVDRGDLRLFLCDSESIIYEFEVGEKNQVYTLPSQNSKCYLKAVGDKCNYSVEIELKVKKVDVPSFEGFTL